MIVRILIVAVIQIAALAAMLADRFLLIASGREAVLAVRPVDPYDPFRGDYVILTYDISQIDISALGSEADFHAAETVFVTIAPSGEPGAWKVTGASHRKPQTVEAAALALKGRVVRTYRDQRTGTDAWAREGEPDFVPPMSEKPAHLCPGGCQVLNVEYGIESYFVQQGTGRPLEEQRNDGSLAAKIAVDEGGRAALKGLLINGETVLEVTLF